MNNKTILIVFKINSKIFSLIMDDQTKIVKIEKRNFIKLKDFISIKSILKDKFNLNFEGTEKVDSFNLIVRDNKTILVPLNFYKIILDEQIVDNGENFIIKKIEFKSKEIIILSIKWILKNYFLTLKEKTVGEDMEKEVKKEDIEKNPEHTNENPKYESNIDEAKKEEIFQQIEKEVDKLKISNFHEVQKKYMKESKSFTPQLVILYSILISLAIVVFIVLNVYSGQQESKMAQEIKNIGGMESLIIRELQRKQEQEKNQLNEQLKEITMQLESLQKQKDQFEKNQIIALNQKTKEIEDEYLKKIEEEKNKLNRGLISRAEFDKRYKELVAEKEKRLQEARNQIDAQRKAFQQQIEAKENELKAKENSYKQALSEKEKQIEQANQAIKVAEEKLALSEEAQKKIEQENEQLKQSSAIQLKLKENLIGYYKAILVAYNNNDRIRLKKALSDFYSFIFNNPSAAIMAEDEKLFDKFVIDIVLNDLSQKETTETKKLEKSKLLEKAINEHKKGNLIFAYENYYLAFTKYDVIVDNEKMYFEDFLKVVFEKQNMEVNQTLEANSASLFNSIYNAFINKNYSLVIQLANNYLSLYPNTKNSLIVVEYKVKSEINLENKGLENSAAKLYQQAKNYFNDQDYDNAVKSLLELFSKYGNTSYSTLGSELLQQIYINVKQNSNSVLNVQEQELAENEVKIGNVFKIFPEIIQILKDPNLATKVEIGDQLIVKHRNDDGTFTQTAIVEVTSYATTIVNAKIIKIFGKGPNIGDYVFLIRK
ncbi:MAG: hypothetical protein NUV32_05460 [Exilispira sp.]|jgi:hypothetical protein|nr:hypothetical protein [Exilispira sp.]